MGKGALQSRKVYRSNNKPVLTLMHTGWQYVLVNSTSDGVPRALRPTWVPFLVAFRLAMGPATKLCFRKVWLNLLTSALARYIFVSNFRK